jgi:hypothetical protein
MKKIACLGFLAFSIVSCSDNKNEVEKDDKTIMFNNFEMIDGWVNNPSLTNEQAHSGKYSIKVDPNIEFSMTYQKPLGQITTKRPKKIELSGWVYTASEKGSAVIGLTINDESGKEVFGSGINLEEDLKDYKEWTLLKKEIELPGIVQPINNLKVFIWRKGATEPVYLDDLQVRVLE